MNFETLPKPQKVSPLIKLTRWTLLLCGIFYGWQKWYYLHDLQERIREERFKMWPSIKAAQEAQAYEDSIRDYHGIANELGIDLPPDWKPDA